MSSLAGASSSGLALVTRVGRRVSRVVLYADLRDDGGEERVRAGRRRREISLPGRGGMLILVQSLDWYFLLYSWVVSGHLA